MTQVNLTLTKSRQSEQTFVVQVNAAAAHSGGPHAKLNLDYALYNPDYDNHTILSLGPEDDEVIFSFFLLPDDLIEGVEKFDLVLSSIEGCNHDCRYLVEISDVIVLSSIEGCIHHDCQHSVREIRIRDTDCESPIAII